jgi:hypothetical protein
MIYNFILFHRIRDRVNKQNTCGRSARRKTNSSLFNVVESKLDTENTKFKKEYYFL